MQKCCPLPFWNKGDCARALLKDLPPTQLCKEVSFVQLHGAIGGASTQQHIKSCLIVREGGRVSSLQKLVAVRFELVRVLTVCARCVFVARCMRSAVAKGASHMFLNFVSHIWRIWHCECYVTVLGVAFFVQGVCVV